MNSILETNLEDLVDASVYQLSTMAPSTWAEANRVMTSDVSPFPGKFSYDKTPYLREIVDTLSPSHPARKVAVMKGAQIGFSTGVIEVGIGYIISENPGNILFLTGHADLAEEAMNGKIDQMIDSCGLRPLIRPNVLRAKNMRTGDTNKSKEFPGGSLVSGSAGNHKLLRQRSVRFGFIDDFDAAKKQTTQSGDTRAMIEQRFAAYSDKMKLYYISTPELRETSNIEPVYLLGDQRKWHWPCPCCGTFIPLEWEIDIEGKDGEKGGITWKLDEDGKLIEDSVGYICQSCGGFFDDTLKYELNKMGRWEPTAKPSEPGYFSYHLSSLYAPPGMDGWVKYVRQYLEANPPGKEQIEAQHKTFVNLCLGLPYESKAEELKANELMANNIRSYDVGAIPEKLSISDGNGKIVMLTCACDLNGIVEDARLDWEIVAWSESGSNYSVNHGSIGTFIPRENTRKIKVDRERWTYEHARPKSVWPELDKILQGVYTTDTGRKMKIMITGVDTGHYNEYAYPYISDNRTYKIGLKGEKIDKYVPLNQDISSFKPSKERNDLYLVQVNKIKDDIAKFMRLRWDNGNDYEQPDGYMNFPTPSDGKYLYANFFSHYESEHRKPETKDGQTVGIKWEKKTSVSQNHFWDVRVYNHAVRDILVWLFCKEMKIQKGTWSDYVDVLNRSVRTT